MGSVDDRVHGSDVSCLLSMLGCQGVVFIIDVRFSWRVHGVDCAWLNVVGDGPGGLGEAPFVSWRAVERRAHFQ